MRTTWGSMVDRLAVRLIDEVRGLFWRCLVIALLVGIERGRVRSGEPSFGGANQSVWKYLRTAT